MREIARSTDRAMGASRNGAVAGLAMGATARSRDHSLTRCRGALTPDGGVAQVESILRNAVGDRARITSRDGRRSDIRGSARRGWQQLLASQRADRSGRRWRVLGGRGRLVDGTALRVERCFTRRLVAAGHPGCGVRAERPALRQEARADQDGQKEHAKRTTQEADGANHGLLHQPSRTRTI